MVSKVPQGLPPLPSRDAHHRRDGRRQPPIARDNVTDMSQVTLDQRRKATGVQTSITYVPPDSTPWSRLRVEAHAVDPKRHPCRGVEVLAALQSHIFAVFDQLPSHVHLIFPAHHGLRPSGSDFRSQFQGDCRLLSTLAFNCFHKLVPRLWTHPHHQCLLL